MLQPVAPINTLELLLPLHDQLLLLLRQLAPNDWLIPTAVPGWSVKDVAAHLLDTDMRRLSSQRDGFVAVSARPSPATYTDLVLMLDQLNAEWVAAAQRISPALLIELLALVGPQVAQLLAKRKPLELANIGVAWAGEQHSAHWFDVAREYTEKWHHQQHIRDAVGAPLLTDRQWLYPVLDTFLRGLPHTYRDVAAPDGTQIAITITGSAGGDWTLINHGQQWQLYWGAAPTYAARVQIDQHIAWRLFTNGMHPSAARRLLVLDGDQTLGEHLLSLLAIMAEHGNMDN